VLTQFSRFATETIFSTTHEHTVYLFHSLTLQALGRKLPI